MQKLVYFDIDGTLMDIYRGVTISELTRQSIATLRKNGHYAVLNTGRSLSMIPQAILDLGFDGILAGCGSHILFQGEELLFAALPEPLIQKIIQLFDEARIDLLVEGPVHSYVNSKVHNQRLVHGTIKLFDSEDQIKTFDDGPIKASKISYVVFDSQKDHHIRLELADDLEFIVYKSGVREGLLPGYTKGSGIDRLHTLLGLEQTESYAIGDSINDLDMLTTADVGIAMANADELTRSTADFITRSVAADGVHHALSHFGLL